MVSDGVFYEIHLRRFVSLYFLVGIIERELRKRVVITLGDFASEFGYLEWLSVIPENYENRIAHFDIEGAERYETEKKVLMWLINAMGGPSA